jgi:hypothetical protein
MRHHGRLVREAPNDAVPAQRNVGGSQHYFRRQTWRSSASEIVNVEGRSCFELGRTWRAILETLLYRPVKTFLEGLGFVVKGEIGGCDLFALRGDDPPVALSRSPLGI